MAYILLPGVMQDHRGKYFQYGRYPNGKCVDVPAPTPELDAKMEAQLERIAVQSKSTLVLGDPNNNEQTERRLAKGDLFKQGEVYETIRCIHESTI